MVTQVERRVRTHSWGKISEEHEELVAQAGRILRANDMGGWTRAAPTLYPHQWSWDAGFIAVGLTHLNTRRAAAELLGLFPDAPPAPPYTSALCQPPTHAIGALRVLEAAPRDERDAAVAFLCEIHPK